MVDLRNGMFHLKLVDNGYRAVDIDYFLDNGAAIFNLSSVYCSALVSKEVLKVSKIWMQPLNYGGFTKWNVSR